MSNTQLNYNHIEQYSEYNGGWNPLWTLANERHLAHVGRLQNTRIVNECLEELNINIEIDDVDKVHEIVNPILIDIEQTLNIDNLASHGVRALRSFG